MGWGGRVGAGRPVASRLSYPLAVMGVAVPPDNSDVWSQILFEARELRRKQRKLFGVT